MDAPEIHFSSQLKENLTTTPNELERKCPEYDTPKHSGKIWGLYDDQALTEAYKQGLNNEELALRFGRSEDAIRRRLTKLNLTNQKKLETQNSYTNKVLSNNRPANAGKKWTLDDDKALIEAHKTGTNYEELATIFGRSITAIVSRLMRLGLIDESNLNIEK
jgi:hypothetical protein